MSALTRMACLDDGTALERAWLQALGRTGSWRLTGPVLELLGEAGTIARLEAASGP